MNNTNDSVISNTEKAAMAQAAASTPKTPPAVAPKATPARAPAPAKKTAQPAKKATPAKTTPAAPRAAAQPKVIDLTPTAATLTFGIVVTLDLTRPELFETYGSDLKAELSRYVVPGTDIAHNLYNPFKPVTSKARLKDPTLARGALRNAMAEVMSVASAFDNANTTYIGDRAAITLMMDKTAKAFGQRVSAALGVDPTADLISRVVAAPSDEPVVLTANNVDAKPADPSIFDIGLTMSDVIRVTSWANTSTIGVDKPTTEAVEEGDTAGDEAQPDLAFVSNVFVNIAVNAASLYTSQDIDKSVGQIRNYLEQTVTRLVADTGSSIPVIFAVNMRANALADARYRDLLVAVMQDDWELMDRRELEEDASAGESTWMPGAEAIGSALLSPTGDLLLLTTIGSDEDEESEATAE